MSAAASKVADLGGDIYAADATERAAKQAKEASDRQFGRSMELQEKESGNKFAAYQNMIGTGGKQFGEGEQDFLSATNQVNPELAAMEADINKGTAKSLQQGAGQLQTELALGGVRGGQASRLLEEGIGDMTNTAQSNITNLKYSDQAQRDAEKRAYLAAKSGRGQSAMLGGL